LTKIHFLSFFSFIKERQLNSGRIQDKKEAFLQENGIFNGCFLYLQNMMEETGCGAISLRTALFFAWDENKSQLFISVLLLD